MLAQHRLLAALQVSSNMGCQDALPSKPACFICTLHVTACQALGTRPSFPGMGAQSASSHGHSLVTDQHWAHSQQVYVVPAHPQYKPRHQVWQQHGFAYAGNGCHQIAHIPAFPVRKMTGRKSGNVGGSARSITRKEYRQGNPPHACCIS